MIKTVAHVLPSPESTNTVEAIARMPTMAHCPAVLTKDCRLFIVAPDPAEQVIAPETPCTTAQLNDVDVNEFGNVKVIAPLPV